MSETPGLPDGIEVEPLGGYAVKYRGRIIGSVIQEGTGGTWHASHVALDHKGVRPIGDFRSQSEAAREVWKVARVLFDLGYAKEPTP